ncbi:RDD family protein [Desulfospira joergensenii]|uniref:RDD family protein n=1 Tax=Desulfospira joergensenii TaxID=53329 RepID=UPI0003B4F174|nr:RDD family protein [Desulfospira joergensenii]
MQFKISGFWKRVGAFFIDAVILGIFGLLLGLFFSQQFVELGGWGRTVGFPIAAIYFVLLNSRIGGGQTIGKRALKIQVVDKNGELISLWKSAFRYSIIGIPYFLNGAMIPESILQPIGFFLVSLLVFGFGLSIFYLILFNRNTRQSLHDIMAGTFVIRKGLVSDKAVKPIWSVHYAVCGLFLVLALLVPIFVENLSQNEFFSELIKTREQIQKIPQVVYATVQDGRSTFSSSDDKSKTTTYLSTQALISHPNIEDERLALQIANIILETHEEAIQRNLVQVVLTYGYDIGIASKWNSRRYSFSPEDWLKKKESNHEN